MCDSYFKCDRKYVSSGRYPHSTSLISIDTPLLAFSDQLLDLSLMFLGPGILRQSDTASEPSGMSLPPSGMPSPRASRRIRAPFSGVGSLVTAWILATRPAHSVI